jgi:hypothetical protein
VIEHPIRLGYMCRKERQGLPPFRKRLCGLALFFELCRTVRDDRQFLGIDQRVTAAAHEVARVKLGAAGFALATFEIQGR